MYIDTFQDSEQLVIRNVEETDQWIATQDGNVDLEEMR